MLQTLYVDSLAISILVLAALETLTQEIRAFKEQTTIEIHNLNDKIEELTKTSEKNDITDAYQKASNLVVALAFGLILTATLAIIVPTVVEVVTTQ